MTIAIPDVFARRISMRQANTDGGMNGEAWLNQVPRLLDERLKTWQVTPDGDASFGASSIAVPVRRGKQPLVIKLTFPHEPARHEHLALQAWRGVGCVRLDSAHPADWALLLERCEPDEELRGMSALDAAEVVGSLHVRLRRPALPQLNRASDWCADTARRLQSAPPAMPRRMIQQGIALATDLSVSSGVDDFLVHSDLHDRKVMRASRAHTVGGRVAIGPKPMAGELAAAVAPLVWNRWEETAAAYNVRNHLRFRVDYACDPMGVDPGRARAWTILRILNNVWRAERATEIHHQPKPDVTRAVAIIKAMQD